LDAPDTLHHVMVQGLERRSIFMDDVDREDFVARVAALAEQGNWTVYAWALPPITPTSWSVPGGAPSRGACGVSSPAMRGPSIAAIREWGISSRTGTSRSWWRRSRTS
jgi:hypothetical protein